jgi:hypothetical protein
MRVDGAPVRRIRLTIDEALSTPRPLALRVYGSDSA